MLSISTGLTSIGAGLQHGVFAGYSLFSGSRRQLEPLSESSGVTPSRFPMSVDAGEGQHFWRHISRAKTVCDHLRAGIKREFKPCPSWGKEANRKTIFHLVSVVCSLSPSQLAHGLSISFILACLELITDGEISAFDGHQHKTGRGLGASRTRKDEMSEPGEPNSAILEII